MSVMVWGAANYEAGQIREQQELSRSIADQRNIEVSELLARYDLEAMMDLDEFQMRQETTELAVDPLSPEFRQKYPDTANFLIDNTTLYSEEVENSLDFDPVIARITAASKADTKDRQLKAALRARRSVVIYCMAAYSAASAELDDQAGFEETG